MGAHSQYAGWFDIDWPAQQGKLLAPVLGAQYGEELRSGKLKLKLEATGASPSGRYDEHKLPVCPLTYPTILGHEDPALDRLADLFLDLPQWRPQVAERARALKAELAAGVARADRRERGRRWKVGSSGSTPTGANWIG